MILFTRLFLLVLMFLSLVSALPCQAQSTSYQYEDIGSVRNLGMGGAGAALMSNRSSYGNPAGIAYPTNEYTISLSSTPGYATYAEYGMESAEGYAISCVGAINRNKDLPSPRRLAFSFDYFGNKITNAYIYDDYGSSGIGDIKSSIYRGTVAYGGGQKYPASVGLTYESTRPTGTGSSSNNELYLGFLVGIPYPGLYDAFILPGETRFNTYPAAGIRIGNDQTYFSLSCKMSWDENDGERNFSKLAITPALTVISSSGQTKSGYGIEAGWYEAVFIRGGIIDFEYNDNASTIGLSLSSRGIIRRLSPKTRITDDEPNTFSHNVDFSFDVAYISQEADNHTLFSITMTIY
ncbi:MAG: hypothetical protein R3F48_03095 [Candidatus Zixiibacteriota bacterium]